MSLKYCKLSVASLHSVCTQSRFFFSPNLLFSIGAVTVVAFFHYVRSSNNIETIENSI